MTQDLPVRKYIKVWIKKRRNPPKKNGRQSTSLTLEWVEFGQRFFLSLGTGATRGYAEAVAKAKESELNSPAQVEQVQPLTWAEFTREYLDRIYPGHDKRGKKRVEASRAWEKSDASRRAEARVLRDFARIVKPTWCHEVTTKERQAYINQRLKEVNSPQSVEGVIPKSGQAAVRLVCCFVDICVSSSSSSSSAFNSARHSGGVQRQSVRRSLAIASRV
jgi:hypothetical protein